ncbi:MAG: transporter ATP-binding protein [Parcubacteria group bacterium]|nr:transporter ATP-binding protein [Parcubacteria group bacterium]
MSRITVARGVWTTFRTSFTNVHRELLSIDRTYVIYEWCSDILGTVRTLGIVVAGGAILQEALRKSTPSWTLVLIGMMGFALYSVFTTLLHSWLTERGEIFDALYFTQTERRMAKHLSTLDLGRMLDPAFLELSQMADRRGTHSINSLWSTQRQTVAAALGILLSSAIILNLDPFLGLLAICFALPQVLRTWFREKRHRELDEQEALTRRQRNEVNESISVARLAVTTRLLSLTRSFVDYYDDLTAVLFNNIRVLARFNRHWRLGIGLIEMVILCLFLWHFASGLVGGKYTIVAMAAIFASMHMLSSELSGFGSSLAHMDHLQRDYDYLVSFFETKPLVDESLCSDVQFRHTPTITVDHASFTYPGSGDPALRDCSLIIKPGEKIALVGKNGSGKTTLLRMLARVYLPSSGTILANSTSLAKMKQNAWLGHAAMIVQDGMLTGVELARALTGKPADALSAEELDRLWKALELTDAKSLVLEDPRGLSVWNGPEWPNGRGFSTGQEQRLLLAAGMYRALEAQMHVVMLDEPTANCDAEMKANFFSALANAPELARHTILVSMHDPLYLHFFNRVLQFENGMLVNDLRNPEEIEKYRKDIALSLAHDL